MLFVPEKIKRAVARGTGARLSPAEARGLAAKIKRTEDERFALSLAATHDPDKTVGAWDQDGETRWIVRCYLQEQSGVVWVVVLQAVTVGDLLNGGPGWYETAGEGYVVAKEAQASRMPRLAEAVHEATWELQRELRLGRQSDRGAASRTTHAPGCHSAR